MAELRLVHIGVSRKVKMNSKLPVPPVGWMEIRAWRFYWIVALAEPILNWIQSLITRYKVWGRIPIFNFNLWTLNELFKRNQVVWKTNKKRKHLSWNCSRHMNMQTNKKLWEIIVDSGHAAPNIIAGSYTLYSQYYDTRSYVCCDIRMLKHYMRMSCIVVHGMQFGRFYVVAAIFRSQKAILWNKKRENAFYFYPHTNLKSNSPLFRPITNQLQVGTNFRLQIKINVQLL